MPRRPSRSQWRGIVPRAAQCITSTRAPQRCEVARYREDASLGDAGVRPSEATVGRGGVVDQADDVSWLKQRIRRMLPVGLALLFLAWILFLVVLIAVGPADPPG